jgi:hypothetical protein
MYLFPRFRPRIRKRRMGHDCSPAMVVSPSIQQTSCGQGCLSRDQPLAGTRAAVGGDWIAISPNTAHSAGMAEGVGFEPTLRFPVNTLSKRAPSATRPPLRTALPGSRTHHFRIRRQARKMGYFPAMRYRTGTVGRHYSRRNRSDKALCNHRQVRRQLSSRARAGVRTRPASPPCQAAAPTTFSKPHGRIPRRLSGAPRSA